MDLTVKVWLETTDRQTRGADKQEFTTQIHDSVVSQKVSIGDSSDRYSPDRTASGSIHPTDDLVTMQ